MKAIGFLLLTFSLVLIALNIISGLKLSYRELQSAEIHLFQAIGIILCTVVGNLLLFKDSENSIQEKQLEWMENENNKPQIEKLQRMKEKCFPSAIVAILACLVSLVTGTIAHPGQFPLLHGGLGFILTGASLTAIVQWIRLYSRIYQAEA